ncbi:NAD(P)/FAD-dependent oxidoreductase [Sporobolomyces salmoneus]|uniref:NAD(P)/FAD-dependent oxidoreductase n=1 Tax=Sporobolomyces salmoneus TaxID=183962 RepID=UPI0031720AD3
MLSYLWPSRLPFRSQPISTSASPPAFSASLLSQFPPSGSIPPSSPPNPHPLNSFWTTNFASPLLDEGRDEPLPEQADVVVIGSGLTGICAIDRLVEQLTTSAGKEEVKIVVLEARQFCSGATARNGGHLTSSPLLSFATLEATFGREEAIRCIQLEKYSIDWIIETCRKEGWTEEVELRVGGGNLHLFDTEEQAHHVRAQLDAARNADQDLSGFEWLSPQQVLDRYQATSKAGGLLIPGNNVYPLKLVAKLFERAQTRANQSRSVSLSLFTHCTVSSVNRPDRENPTYPWQVKTAPRGTISARHVLHCTNGYLSSVLPQFSTGPSRIYPTRGQVLSVVSHPESDPPTPTWPRFGNAFSAEDPYDIYMFQRSSPPSTSERREIILGGCRDRSGAASRYEFGQSFDGEGSLNERVGEGLKGYLDWQFPRLFPGSGDVEKEKRRGRWEVDMEWTGIMGFREGGIPIVGPVYLNGEVQDGQWVAAGYSGHGMPRAPASGHLLASLVYQALLNPTSTAKEPQLPPHFPRHYLTTSTGLPDVEATVPGEDTLVAHGWVWVESPSKEKGIRREMSEKDLA